MRRHLQASTAGTTQRRCGVFDQSGGGKVGVAPASIRDGGGRGSLLARLFVASLLPALLLAAAVIPSFADAAAPIVSGTSFSRVTTTAATLEGEVDPNGEPTTYHFEYGSQGPCGSNPCVSKPVPDASAGTVAGAISVSRVVAGLNPGTTYYFRLVATNASSPVGGTAGPDATFTTYALPSSLVPCPNDPFRGGHGAALPDCRAYEQASPVEKDGNDISGGQDHLQASPDGDALLYQVYGGIPGGLGAESYPSYISSRGVANWSTRGVLPAPDPEGTRIQEFGWAPDLRLVLFRHFHFGGFPLPQAYMALDVGSGLYTDFTPYFNGASYFFAGTSADDSKVFFEARATGSKLTPDAATGKTNLYLWDRDTDTISLVGVLPESQGGAAPAKGSFAGPFEWFAGTGESTLARGGATASYYTQSINAIASDGDKAFFTAGGTGQIYLRKGIDGPTPETVQVSATQRTTPDPNGSKPAIFMRATPDGSKAFFTSCEKLTDDSTAVSTGEEVCDTEEQGQDLYVYDSASGNLTDLTVDGADPRGADVKGVLGASDDGSYVYFAANGVLAGNAGARESHATLGNCRARGGSSFLGGSGTCNLYVAHAGAVSFVAPLEAETPGSSGADSDAGNWEPAGESISVPQNTARVSSDGRTLLFRSQQQLSVQDHGAVPQFYWYRIGMSDPVCVSCNPSGGPSGKPEIIGLQAGTEQASAIGLTSRILSADGNRAFFATSTKLAAADVNGDDGCPLYNTAGATANAVPSCQDVYEWEADGAGSCHSSTGCTYLLSAGSGPDPSFFVDASASGNDVFIFSRDRLVPQDQDEIEDAYDVRVGGGLAAQNQPPPPPPCEGEGCRGEASQASTSQGAGSAAFAGPGNPKPKRHAKGRHHRPKRHGHAPKRHREGANGRHKRAHR